MLECGNVGNEWDMAPSCKSIENTEVYDEPCSAPLGSALWSIDSRLHRLFAVAVLRQRSGRVAPEAVPWGGKRYCTDKQEVRCRRIDDCKTKSYFERYVYALRASGGLNTAYRLEFHRRSCWCDLQYEPGVIRKANARPCTGSTTCECCTCVNVRRTSEITPLSNGKYRSSASNGTSYLVVVVLCIISSSSP